MLNFQLHVFWMQYFAQRFCTVFQFSTPIIKSLWIMHSPLHCLQTLIHTYFLTSHNGVKSFVSTFFNASVHNSFGDTLKGMSDLKARFVYSDHNARSCENLFSCPNSYQNWEASAVSLNVLYGCLIFFSSMSFNPNWHEGGYFYLFVQTFWEVKIDILQFLS